MGAPDFPQIEELNTLANFCAKYFLSRINKNGNGSVATRKKHCAMQTKPTTPLTKKRTTEGNNVFSEQCPYLLVYFIYF